MELSDSWKWVLTFVATSFISVAGALGVNKLLLNRQQHNSQIANKELDFDKEAFNYLVNEVKSLKLELTDVRGEVRQLRDDLAFSNVQNARLETDNGHLLKENESLRKRIREMEREFNDTRVEMERMKLQIKALEKA